MEGFRVIQNQFALGSQICRRSGRGARQGHLCMELLKRRFTSREVAFFFGASAFS